MLLIILLYEKIDNIFVRKDFIQMVMILTDVERTWSNNPFADDKPAGDA